MQDLTLIITTLLREAKENWNKWTATPCSWIQKPNIIKIEILPKFICKFNEIPTKTPTVIMQKLTILFEIQIT
jgi:hypothetical protein